jgi:hypothetical protein
MACGGNKGGDEAGGESGESGCDWFTADNCWKRAIRAMDACLPDSRTDGVFEADGQTCTFADGSRIVFSALDAFTTPGEWQQMDFREVQLLDSGGDVCGEISFFAGGGETGWTLEAGGESVTERTTDGSMDTAYECADGAGVVIDMDMLDCDGLYDSRPGLNHTATTIYLAYDAVTGAATTELFACAM